MKLRFSLRTLLILTTCAAALCWWRTRPNQIASEFKADFAAVAGVTEALELCGIQSLATVNHWTIQDVRIGEFRRPTGTAGWLLNHQVATLKVYAYDRDAGYGSTHGLLSASAWGVAPRMSGSWQSELPPLIQWFLE